MSDSQTTNPTEPQLCKNGCGFFGNSATDGCCSKCWRENLKKQGGSVPSGVPPTCSKVTETSSSVPMEVEAAEVCQPVTPKKVDTPSTATLKKRKKKSSYKAMMAGMMKSQSPQRDVEKERESLRKVTGGGAFSKIEKI